MPHRYKTRTIEIEAAHWNGSTPKATDIINWILENGGTANFHCGQQCCDNELDITIDLASGGTEKVEPQDYVIRNLATGQFQAMKPDSFDFRYEKMTEAHI